MVGIVAIILTLASLLPRGADFTFNWQGQTPSFEILKRDITANLALVKFSGLDLPSAGFNFEPKLGQRVFVLAKYPQTVVDTKQWLVSVNEGIISQLGGNALLTTMTASAATQGSPVFDLEGRVLGLATLDQQNRVIILPASTIRAFSGL